MQVPALELFRPTNVIVPVAALWCRGIWRGKTIVGVIRSTFVVGADGKVELAQYNVKATGHVAKLRKDLHL